MERKVERAEERQQQWTEEARALVRHDDRSGEERQRVAHSELWLEKGQWSGVELRMAEQTSS